MNLNSKEGLLRRLRKGRSSRSQFVESHIKKGIAYQIRAIRDSLGWSQERLAKEVGMPQNAVSRLESPDYGRPTLTTLRRLAAAFDVGLVVRFVPFSELIDWVSGTPRINQGLNSSALEVPAFGEEEERGSLESPAIWIRNIDTASGLKDIAYVETNRLAVSVQNVGSVPPLRKPASSEYGLLVLTEGNTNNGVMGVMSHVR
jgi:transcriptional regulator with XRE-family HTH domain